MKLQLDTFGVFVPPGSQVRDDVLSYHEYLRAEPNTPKLRIANQVDSEEEDNSTISFRNMLQAYVTVSDPKGNILQKELLNRLHELQKVVKSFRSRIGGKMFHYESDLCVSNL